MKKRVIHTTVITKIFLKQLFARNAAINISQE